MQSPSGSPVCRSLLLREAPGDRIEKIYLSETYFKSQWKEKEAEAPWEVVRDSVFKAMCDTQAPAPSAVRIMVPKFPGS